MRSFRGSAMGLNVDSRDQIQELHGEVESFPWTSLKSFPRQPLHCEGTIVRQEDTPDHSARMRIYRTVDGYEFWYSHGQRFFVSIDGATIVDASEPDTELGLRIATFLGPVLSVAASLHGRCVLHGSAVRINDEAILFLGKRGVGKSTIAAYLATQGFSPWSDDSCTVCFEGPDPVPTIAPGPAKFRLWPDSAGALGEHSQPLYAGTSKVGQPWDCLPNGRPIRLAMIVLLGGESVSNPTHEKVSRAQAFKSLLDNSRVRDCFKDSRLQTHLDQLSLIASSTPIVKANLKTGLNHLGLISNYVLEEVL